MSKGAGLVMMGGVEGGLPQIDK